jgi:hypothetical protein
MGPNGETRNRSKDLPKLIRLVTIALAVVAVVKELRTPRDEREWNGVVVGFVPYDFRVPTAERIMERVWDPDGPRLINPRVFGVGWTLNIGKLVGIVQERFVGDR